jgi:hypothetical protein
MRIVALRKARGSSSIPDLVDLRQLLDGHTTDYRPAMGVDPDQPLARAREPWTGWGR